jgi:hypothetical protein
MLPTTVEELEAVLIRMGQQQGQYTRRLAERLADETEDPRVSWKMLAEGIKRDIEGFIVHEKALEECELPE